MLTPFNCRECGHRNAHSTLRKSSDIFTTNMFIPLNNLFFLFVILYVLYHVL